MDLKVRKNVFIYPTLASFTFNPILIIVRTFISFEVDLLAMMTVLGFIVCFKTGLANEKSLDFVLAPYHGIVRVSITDLVEALLSSLTFQGS